MSPRSTAKPNRNIVIDGVPATVTAGVVVVVWPICPTCGIQRIEPWDNDETWLATIADCINPPTYKSLGHSLSYHRRLEGVN